MTAWKVAHDISFRLAGRTRKLAELLAGDTKY
jgi:hypothetical protein